MADRRQGTPAAGGRTARAKPGAPADGMSSGRDARLKAALKANIARRKARAQALDGDDPPIPGDPAPVEKD
jgi:hypothetical protein